jgi:ATP-binding cassette subfamily C protein
MLLVSIITLFALVNFKVAVGIFLYFSVIGYATNKVIGPRMQRAGKKFAESSPAAAKALNDSVVAYREILTLGKEQEFLSKFSIGRLSIAKSTAYSTFYSGVPRYIVETALMIGALLLSTFVLRDSNPTKAVGTLGIFLTGSVRIMASMLPLQAAMNSLKDIVAKSQPFFDLAEPALARFDSNILINHSISQESKPISICFDNVSFNYPGTNKLAVNNVSFKINPGEYVALIGPSGSGKSTIADLLIKLIEPISGNVTYTNLNQAEARIGYVPQSPGIVSGSILDNLTLNVASGEFDQYRLNKSLDLAHLRSLVTSLKQGVNTDLGAHSDGLSGGQMQRIGLARALYAQPGLLVLDEATSALDAETESAVAESLFSLKGTCTLVVIAHRLSTVQNADCVYVIDDGKIVDSGTFSDLAKTNSLVARYVELSQLNY